MFRKVTPAFEPTAKAMGILARIISPLCKAFSLLLSGRPVLPKMYSLVFSIPPACFEDFNGMTNSYCFASAVCENSLKKSLTISVEGPAPATVWVSDSSAADVRGMKVEKG